ncbi:DUF7344 domain-containing protein [Haladaptatus sp. DFWS20]|uniref:DUF7344 domain-containing protein n=1 Tax=Haladaptatus sp. DFWS20 TaxID=3403467 RepID=UPI003EB87DD0
MSASPNTADSAGDIALQSEDTVDPHPLSKDTIFHLLQVERRRLVLQYLQDRTDTVPIRDLAEQVAAWENETTVEQLSSTERQRTYIALYQSHLQKFDTEGIIEYNKDRGTIRRTSRADQLEPYLPETVQQCSTGSSETDLSERRALNQRWELYYLGGSLFNTSLLGAKLLHLPLVSHLPSRWILSIILLVFSLITAGHYYARSALFESDSTTG